MENRPSLIRSVARLWVLLQARRRRQFYLLIIIMIAASFAEIFSLGMIVPFLLVLTAPERVMTNPIAHSILSALGLSGSGNVVLLVAAAFCFATVLAAAVRLLLLYASTGYSFALGADFSLEVYRRTLYRSYATHVTRNSSEVINGVVGKANEVSSNVIGQLLILFSAAFLFVGLIGTLLTINYVVTLSAVAAFAVIYGGIMWGTRRRLRRDSHIIAKESPRVLRALQEGLGGIRDVLIDGTQETFIDIYRTADRTTRAAQGRIALTVGSPQFLVEGLGMIFIALLAVSVSHSGGGESVIPVLGALALGAQRLLPVVQQSYSAIITIRGSEASLGDVIGLLSQPITESSDVPFDTIPFSRALELEGVKFSYVEGGPEVLRGIDLTIAKGARVGIFGPTGGGKSTLIDVIMGLLDPTAGRVTVDGTTLGEATRRGWRAHIAHVPQSIFLSNSSIAENIAFGVPSQLVDRKRVRRAAELAQIANTIKSWPLAYNSPVGERGVRLSGGQRQRIGIARALYKRADVIVFDEATNALDGETEREVVSAIKSLSHDLTIIMVAHRLTTLRGCDLLIEVSNGRTRIADPSELVGRTG